MTEDERRTADDGRRNADEKRTAESTQSSVVRLPSSAIRPPSSDSDHPPPVAVSPHLLTWWFGLMALGGVGFGLYAEERPFGTGVIAYPLVVFFAVVAAGLLTLRFLHARPVPELISERCLAAGIAIGIACFFVGNWFGVSLTKLP
jgi:hypothetical protein